MPKSPKAVPRALSDTGVFGRGLLMGLAEVVPGVSGGTIAFISGIYPQLVAALASFGPQSLTLLRDPVAFWRHHDGRFLLVLGAGMALGVLAFARVMHWLLATYEPLVWAFFSGVVAASVVAIGRQCPPLKLLLWGSVGTAVGIGLLWLPVMQQSPALWWVFVGGAVAVCAWLLPAVSGSYVLLLLGLYGPVITALSDLQWALILTLVAGCAIGLLLFAQVLAWLLAHHRHSLLSLLTGFMLGALPKLWPWQLAATDGVVALRLSPAAYTQATGEPAFVLAVMACAMVGAAALWWLSRSTRDAQG